MKLPVGPHHPYPFWKVLWLVCLPIAAAYQVVWGLYFNFAPEHFWVDGTGQALIVWKLASELVLYAVMLWFLIARSVARYLVLKVVTCAALLGVLGYTAVGLYRGIVAL